MKHLTLTLLTVSALFISAESNAKDLPLEKLRLKPGFHISIYAEVKNPRQMVMGDGGVLYVGTRRAGKVWAITDEDGDYSADKVQEIDTKLSMPSGVAYLNGDLYVGAVNRILKYEAIGANLDNPPDPIVMTDKLPKETHHGWKFIRFSPDNTLYIPVGAPCNICLQENPVFATILTMAPVAHAELKVFASGVRNTVGFDWHPETKELWFTDNGRDWMGDYEPACELNHAPRPGMHFGFPFFHAGSISDPKFGEGRKASEFVRPALKLGPHIAPLGMTFYRGTMFPEEYHHQIFIPEHGSWNRTPKAGHTGYRITTAISDNNGILTYGTFIDGWLQNNRAWGRPASLLELSDGSLLISDDSADVIYRVTFSASEAGD